MTPLQKQVLTHVECCIKQANQRLNKRLTIPTINFNQRGKIAGTAHLQKWELRFNPILLTENPDAFLNEVVAHEVAHLVVFKHFGRVRPHGREWQIIMTEVFHVTPRTTMRTNATKVFKYH